jgi:cytochrome c2
MHPKMVLGQKQKKEFQLKGISLILGLVLFISSYVQAADPKNGETLFKKYCTQCHAIGYVVNGPALKGITSTETEDWFVQWIINNKKLRDSGDKDALAIYAKYNQAQMNVFEGILKKPDVLDILAYIKQESAAPATPTAVAGGSGSGSGSDGGSSWLTLAGLIGVIAILFGVIAILNRVIKTLEKLLLMNKGKELLPLEDIINEHGEVKAPKVKIDRFAYLKRLSKNKQVVVLVFLITTVAVTALAWDQMLDIGITQGYQPVQPIKYSHQLHAGTLKIACQYCHGGAWKSKNAGIPSANICMNCHKAVQLREKYNGQVSPEIAKIYKALDYNPDTRSYGTNQTPIQWVKIHQLQDFVYFNHSQHVKVGKLVCQQCHGPVQAMKEVYQYSPLTMGWCINCHRVTKVAYQNNGYYDKMMALHDEFKKGQTVTVAMMGGIECAKCHY